MEYKIYSEADSEAATNSSMDDWVSDTQTLANVVQAKAEPVVGGGVLLLISI